MQGSTLGAHLAAEAAAEELDTPALYRLLETGNRRV